MSAADDDEALMAHLVMGRAAPRVKAEHRRLLRDRPKGRFAAAVVDPATELYAQRPAVAAAATPPGEPFVWVADADKVAALVRDWLDNDIRDPSLVLACALALRGAFFAAVVFRRDGADRLRIIRLYEPAKAPAGVLPS